MIALVFALAALIAEPSPSPPPGEVVVQQRPDRKGDAYAYSVEVRTQATEDGKPADRVERQRFQVEVEEASPEALRVRFVRSLSGEPAPGGGVDALWDHAWLDIPLVYKTTRQGTPTEIVNIGPVEAAYTENMRRLLGAPKNAFLASVKARFADASPFQLAGGSSGLLLANVAFLQHRGPEKLGRVTDPPKTAASGATVIRTVEISEHDPANCRIRVTHDTSYVGAGGPTSQRQRLLSTAVVSTWDGWVIDYRQERILEGPVAGEGKITTTTRIVREGKAPVCG